jgi:hypothetical protein
MEIKNKNDVELYCCYSLNLREFLYNNGLRYKLAALNPNSKSLFWVYIKDKKLDKLLTEWSKNKQNTSNQ